MIVWWCLGCFGVVWGVLGRFGVFQGRRFPKKKFSALYRGSSVVSALASGARGPRFDPLSGRGKFRSPNTLSLVSFAGMTLDKCIVPRIGTLTGCPLCRESHPLCRLKNPTVISLWLLVGFHPATRCVQCTPVDNARKRAPGSI